MYRYKVFLQRIKLFYTTGRPLRRVVSPPRARRAPAADSRYHVRTFCRIESLESCPRPAGPVRGGGGRRPRHRRLKVLSEARGVWLETHREVHPRSGFASTTSLFEGAALEHCAAAVPLSSLNHNAHDIAANSGSGERVCGEQRLIGVSRRTVTIANKEGTEAKVGRRRGGARGGEVTQTEATPAVLSTRRAGLKSVQPTFRVPRFCAEIPPAMFHNDSLQS
ncbi:hypothetical protein EVAR_4761_1 [Eumeta japonica]|uniref:Uncharacterized protein n=1 Tax=Eumeta variegata TaxID=151549 RepID=A0A4C1SZS4_EUMVA|nr:hypothetical protein EVAR_4761_1 [Eumeta japonica]